MMAAMRRALPIVAALVLTALACSKPPLEPLQLERNLLTVNNQSSSDWTGVEVWLNRQFRFVMPIVAAGGRSQVPLDAFVSGYGQRFNFGRMQIVDLRLSAKRPDGSSFEVKKAFTASGLAGVFGGKH
jgi:hypothetical protein